MTNIKFYLLFIFSFFILINISSATSGTTVNMWLYYAITVIISLLLAGIYYALSQVAQSPQVAAQAKNEFKSVIGTIILGIILYTLIFGTDITSKIIGGSSDATLWTTVHNNVGYQFNILQKGFRQLHRGYYLIGKIVGYSYTATISLPSLATKFESGMPGIGLSTIYGQYGQIFQTLSQGMLFIIGELVIIKFAIFAVPLFIFPLGLILRLFSPTRRWGSTVIALGIGMYFILPFSAVFNSLIYRSLEGVEPVDGAIDEMNQNIMSVMPIDKQPPNRWLICSPVVVPFAALGHLGFRAAIVCGPLCTIEHAADLGAGWLPCYIGCVSGGTPESEFSDFLYYVAQPGYQWGLSGPLKNFISISDAQVEQIGKSVANVILPVISYQWMLAMMLPVLNYIITIGFIRSLSTAIGGEVYFYGITKIL
ncbi:hypothetical protein J7J90_03415 [Candidatus Micrarchaeota archaeon]|nr:hypothetical protein [Candidatus Micrarchaeota archaeon]